MPNIAALQEQIILARKEIQQLNDKYLINKILENVISHATQADATSIWLYKQEKNAFVKALDYDTSISIHKKEGLFYKAYVSNAVAIYNNITSEKGYTPSIDNFENFELKSKIFFPLNLDEKFLGIITLSLNEDNNKKFTYNDVEMLRAIKPFLLENLFIDRRAKKSKDSGQRRRQDDVIENLNTLQSSRELPQTSQAMLDSISNIVHDIRTPANGLYGFLEILQEQVQDERLKIYIKHAKESAQLINELTTSILDGVSTKKEPNTSETKSINSIKFFSDVAEIFSANMFKKNIQYNIFIDPFLPKEIVLDSMKIKRVIMNLIGNASKFTPQNGSIEFSVRYKQKEKKLHIFVKDSGIGIAKEKQSEIFEAFKQAEDTTKELYGGTGLGLSICAAYVKELGGKLLLESQLNKGSTFYFSLPMEIKDYAIQFKTLKDQKTVLSILMNKENSFVANHIARYFVKMGIDVDKLHSVASVKLIPPETTHLITFEKKLTHEVFSFIKIKKLKHLVVEENFLSLKSSHIQGAQIISQYTSYSEALYSFVNEEKIPKILIVEDDPISISLLKTMLDDEYCDIDTVIDGEEGLSCLHRALAKEHPYSIVYSDENMPKLSGSQMIQKYKKLEEEKNIRKTKFAYISGDECQDKHKQLFDYCLNKPFKKSEVVSIFTEQTQ
ncbi:ATP-binding protein [Sulfurimonas sp.]|uniref:hybrid sensor histidine kinase/response regulator n=1 Tax=Sulfurimonas sp. TaxID=2022749 RepID=UPI002601B474|nr:ATP-binding protein [Sulfurimonas sp.]